MKKNKTTSFASQKNTEDRVVSPNKIEDGATKDIRELLLNLVVSPIMDKIPTALNKTEAGIKDIDEKAENILNNLPNSSAIASDVEYILESSVDFTNMIAEASGAEEVKSDIEEIKGEIKGLKNDVGNIDGLKKDVVQLKNKLDNVVTKTNQISASAKQDAVVLKNNLDKVVKKTDQLSASTTEAHDNITKLIETLIEKVEAQRKMIEKQTETIEQQRSIIEKYVSEMSSANNKLNRMNRQFWKTHR